MPRTRKFKKINDKLQKQSLLQALAMAMQEHPDIQDRSYNHRTDVIGIACQYGKCFGMTREDFKLIKDMTIDELIDEFDENYR